MPDLLKLVLMINFFKLLIFYYICFLFCFSEEILERDKFMSPDEAKEFGLIDRVLSSAPSFDEIRKEQEKND